MGLLAGRFAAAEQQGREALAPPPTTALGALVAHISGGAEASTFQPMNVNYGLFPPIEAPKQQDGKRLRGKERGRARKQAHSHRALRDLDTWMTEGRAAAE